MNSPLPDLAGTSHQILKVRGSRLVIAACIVAVGSALFFLPKSADLALLAVLLLVLGAEFVNGWTDAPNAIATVVGTRSLSPPAAMAMAAVFNLIGVMSGTAV